MCRIVGNLSDNRVNVITAIMREACRKADSKIVGQTTHKYDPQGFSLILILAESHLSVHTFPEYGFATIDYFTCAGFENEKAEIADKKVNIVLEHLKRYYNIPDEYLSIIRR